MILIFSFLFRKDEERKKNETEGDSIHKDVSSPSVCACVCLSESVMNKRVCLSGEDSMSEVLKEAV